MYRPLLYWPPFPSAAACCDLDFIHRRYFFNGAPVNFTTFANASFASLGLLPTSTVDITLLLSTVGFSLPGAIFVVFFQNGTPGATRTLVQLDDGTANHRVSLLQQTSNNPGFQVVTGGVQQAFATVTGAALQRRHGISCSSDTNSFLSAGDGAPGAADTAGTLPTVTTLRIGKATGANTEFLGILSRIVLFKGAQLQEQLNALSTPSSPNL